VRFNLSLAHRSRASKIAEAAIFGVRLPKSMRTLHRRKLAASRQYGSASRFRLRRFAMFASWQIEARALAPAPPVRSHLPCRGEVRCGLRAPWDDGCVAARTRICLFQSLEARRSSEAGLAPRHPPLAPVGQPL